MFNDALKRGPSAGILPEENLSAQPAEIVGSEIDSPKARRSRFIWRLVGYAAGLVWMWYVSSEEFPLITGVAFLVFFDVLISSVFRFGHSVGVAEIALLLAGVQWIVLAHYAYRYDSVFYFRYTMQIPEKEYYATVLPVYVGYVLGIRLVQKPVLWERAEDERERDSFWNFIFVVSLLMYGISFFSRSFVFVLGGILFILCWAIREYYLRTSWRKYLPLICVVGNFLVISIRGGMFHSLLLCLLFIVLFVMYRQRTKPRYACLILLSAVFACIVLQIVKPEYRNQRRWSEDTTLESTSLFVSLTSQRIQDIISGDFDATQMAEQLLPRYNCGWIISHAVAYSDRYKIIFYGKTVFDSMLAIIFPRVLFSNKRMSGGVLNMATMAGLQLNENTSMNVTYVGEGYCNFGRFGAPLFLFALGVLLALLLNFTCWCQRRYGIGFFFIPAIFFYSVRAESDFLTGFNSPIKTLLMIAIYCCLFRLFHGMSLIPRKARSSGISPSPNPVVHDSPPNR